MKKDEDGADRYREMFPKAAQKLQLASKNYMSPE